MIMTVWQADFYRRPLRDAAGNALWELVVCDPSGTFTAFAMCPQPDANSIWLAEQLKRIGGDRSPLPNQIQIFRPQIVSLVEAACQPLGIEVQATRHTPALKRLLQDRTAYYRTLENYTHQSYEPIKLEQPPPLPLPENLWGEQWRFAAIAASDLVPVFANRPIPIREMPEDMLPVNLNLPSTTPIPGVVIDGGRQSMRLARWLQQANPVCLNYIPGDPDGLILEAGLVDRWVVATFTDADVIAAAKTFRDRQQVSQGLHFLLVQPDDSGMTYSGFWLLQTP
ncbi:MAG TPA: Tab2/Atab2 family RNA-binding protein [Crinalium sp.]